MSATVQIYRIWTTVYHDTVTIGYNSIGYIYSIGIDFNMYLDISWVQTERLETADIKL